LPIRTTATRERGFFIARVSPFLTLRAGPEELELVGNPTETVPPADFLLKIVHQAFLELYDPGAALADQVMVMTVVSFSQELKAGHAVAEFVALNHAHAFEEVKGAINGGQIAAIGERLVNVAYSQGVVFLAEQVQDGLARTGELAGATPETAGQLGEREASAALGRMLVRMGVGVLSHGEGVFPVGAWRSTGIRKRIAIALQLEKCKNPQLLLRV
jgi:hypothetical protein